MTQKLLIIACFMSALFSIGCDNFKKAPIANETAPQKPSIKLVSRPKYVQIPEEALLITYAFEPKRNSLIVITLSKDKIYHISGFEPEARLTRIKKSKNIRLRSITFSKDGTKLVALFSSNDSDKGKSIIEVIILDIDTGEEQEKVILDPEWHVVKVANIQDDKLIGICRDGQDQIVQRDLHTGEILSSVKDHGWNIRLSGNGEILLVLESHKVRIWNLVNGNLDTTFNYGSSEQYHYAGGASPSDPIGNITYASDAAISFDGSSLAIVESQSSVSFHGSGASRDYLCLVDSKNGNKLATANLHLRFVDHLAISPDGKVVAVSGGTKSIIMVWDIVRSNPL